MNVVWFKRDLRVEDHEALSEAAKAGLVLPLYILEPELWQQPDMGYRHYIFLHESLKDLNTALQALGQRLIIKVGDAVSVLQDIHERHRINALWSHQETWNAWTYERDKKVKQWAASMDVQWHEPAQNGVIRGLRNRDGWAAKWYMQMKKPICDKPRLLHAIAERSSQMPTPEKFGLKVETSMSGHPIVLQKGGRSEAIKLIYSFFYERGEGYTKEMSSPVTAFEACSRLSAHFAFGNLSLREIFKTYEQRKQILTQMPPSQRGSWLSAMRSFSGRLRWHCHFIQKLEDEPRIEFENMHPTYNGLRENSFNNVYFEAWKTGKTGYPMIDACMRALIATGWLNFRMRAMLMSFASYHLWLHWREPALHLAKLFVDYEPGIHYSQAQMQSGTTGINAIRIYNPIKQGMDHDPEGVFIRSWVPELRHLNSAFIHTPWLAPQQINGYPLPIVDEKTARKAAAQQLYGLRKNNTAHAQTAQAIVKKHGSRKSRSGLKTDKNQSEPPFHIQLKLPF